jgi:hypothetical protein
MATWRGDSVAGAVKAVRCFGVAYVYWRVGQFTVAEREGNHGELLGLFTGRAGEWLLERLIRESLGR